jgi:hypothetical protein
VLNASFFRAAIFGIALTTASQLAAQTQSSGTSEQSKTGSTTSGTSGSTSTTSSASGGVVNMPQDTTPSRTGTGSGTLQLRDLLNYKIQAQDGAFGRVSDVVFDRNGNIQYLLGSYQGSPIRFPFLPALFRRRETR